ncbi:MAG: adenosylcobinamide-GDP ribazoletransferase [Rhizobiales bacterium]|nr:adenosylcobinamide-GDP ribazoletransferase [Hyphomicrobiales bacterium]
MNDLPPARNGLFRGFRPLAEVLVSLRFLTRLPIPFVRRLDPPPLAQSMRFFPVAGIVIGLIAGGLLALAQTFEFPSLFSAVLAAALSIILTGALHEDGLADVADGFGGGKSREHRLEIMRDSRIGTYGTLALVLAVLAKISLLEALQSLQPLESIILIATAAGFSRALVVDLLWATKPARSDGLSVLAGRPSRNGALVALLLGGGLAFAGAAYALSPEAAAFAIIAGGVTLAAIRALAMRMIGGQTGDVCGAVQVLSEIAMLAVYVVMIG